MLDAQAAPSFSGAANSQTAVLEGQPLVGNLLRFRDNPINVFNAAAALPGEVVKIPVAYRDVYLVKSPEGVKYVLQDKVNNFSKQTRGYAQLRKILGNGLVTSEGSFWLRQRRIAQPAFHRQKIAAFADTMAKLSGELVERWKTIKDPIDVSQEMTNITLRIVGWTLLSTEVGTTSSMVNQALGALLHEVIERTTALIDWPLYIPTRSNRVVVNSRRELDRIVLGIISERRGRDDKGSDLLGMLMAAKDEETGESMSDEQLRDEVMTLFLAGHETTANALSWTFYLLSQHPDVRAKVTAEAKAVLQGRLPTFADLMKLPYTLQVVEEAMRLYPPVWLLMRRAESDDVVLGHKIPKHAFVAVSPWVTHRDARYFPEPEAFKPERFAPEAAAASQPRFAYFPFAGGPRVCIGKQFALMEAQLVLATLAQHFTLDLVEGHPVAPDPAVTLRPKHGLQIRISAA